LLNSIIQVHLTLLNFDIEESDNCNKDYLELHERGPDGPLLGRFCGNAINVSNLTASDSLWIKFRSDESVSGAGFIAEYSLGTK
jgi:cubilin